LFQSIVPKEAREEFAKLPKYAGKSLVTASQMLKQLAVMPLQALIGIDTKVPLGAFTAYATGQDMEYLIQNLGLPERNTAHLGPLGLMEVVGDNTARLTKALHHPPN